MSQTWFAELRALGQQSPRSKRSSKAWNILLEAIGEDDFPVLRDFALENSLIEDGDASGPEQKNASWINPADDSEMIWIPGGPFFVGADSKRTECPGFSLARFPITNHQFARFVEEAGYQPPANHPDSELYLRHWQNGPPQNKLDHPVVWVSYVDALHYCRWAGLTLPTEWHWEKAARGCEGRRYPWGDQSPKGTKLTNVRSRDTCPVGQFPETRTPYGCEDLVGNISEWCQMTGKDQPDVIPGPIPQIPTALNGPDEYTAVRGSCFLRIVDWRMVNWHRRRLLITRRNRWVGFRPACMLPIRPIT